MPADLAPRIRSLLADTPHIAEVRMFGGLCFTLNGHMLCADSHTGQLLLRLSAADHQAALGRPGVSPMVMRGRPMAGYLYVARSELAEDAALERWIAMAVAHVSALPPKKSRKKAAAAG
ncbi:hypothetical protein LL06_19145 [Hoeflea sp. BAL378]|uniref:TfoX/Sxy family protein n=1 Tax=Hoeflea sp. BAL378 TaxID=1547437 RepID=UPI0005144B9D|nr:TfoX/Sxy family protein [Hoeflea sp. BAL378]KGF67988.1 hypothetical protein LL06_19145 [Hoeflea sp. BAL378]